MELQDKRAVESMIRCGLDLEAVCESFPKFDKTEIEEIYNSFKGNEPSGQAPVMKLNCS